MKASWRASWLTALGLAGALFLQCRHAPVDAPARPSEPPALPEPIEFSALEPLRGQRLEDLRVSADGRLLFTRWARAEGAEGGSDFRVVHLPDGREVWSAKGVLRNGLWLLGLSPEGSAGFVFLPLEAQSPLILFRASGAPQALDVEFPGGAWARGGAWFGGPIGAFNADGSRRGKAVPDWLKVDEELFLPGSQPNTLRYLSDGKAWEWDGQNPPTEVGVWHCSARTKQHRLTTSSPPPLSPDGRYIAWVLKSTNALTLCDGDSGTDVELAPQATPAAWADARHLWWIDAGRLVGVDVSTGKRMPARTLPEGQKAVALSASTEPSALFIGTDQGRLYRLPLGG